MVGNTGVVCTQESRLQDKVRVYALARELNMESKDLLDMCRHAGIDVKNQLSSLDPDQRLMIEQMVKRGGSAAVATASRPSAGTPHVAPQRVPTLSNRPLPTRRVEPE